MFIHTCQSSIGKVHHIISNCDFFSIGGTPWRSCTEILYPYLIVTRRYVGEYIGSLLRKSCYRVSYRIQKCIVQRWIPWGNSHSYSRALGSTLCRKIGKVKINCSGSIQYFNSSTRCYSRRPWWRFRFSLYLIGTCLKRLNPCNWRRNGSITFPIFFMIKIILTIIGTCSYHFIIKGSSSITPFVFHTYGYA